MRLNEDQARLPGVTAPAHTVVDVVDGHPVYDDGHGNWYVDRDDISGADAVRDAVLDGYATRPPVTVRHALLVQYERDWYEHCEDVVEVAGMYVDQDGTVLGDHSDCWWVTWVVGADCLAVLSRRGRIRVAPGAELDPSDTLLAVLCPRCGDAIGVDTMLDHDQAGVLRCRWCELEVETESIDTVSLGKPVRTADISIRLIPQPERLNEPEPDCRPVPKPDPVRPRVLEW